MALLFVRHAQASYGTDDYDRLSPLGWTQAGHLGTWLAGEPHGFARARVGAMRRHRETFEAIRRAFAEAGHPLPEPEEDADLNEFDHGAVIRAYLVERADADMRARAGSHDPTVVGPMLYAAILAWANDELDAVPERWSVFGERVARAGAAAVQATSEGPALVVSSGGVIARLAQQALEVPATRAVDLNLAIRNASINEFSARHGALRFGSFNTLPHLAHDRRLWTHF
ncbi:histidine phosphatase family protein [Silanimonas sp.]|uniref:histidine phosphatase family protein n=1 Tax=Silanimonas sp. TaxID=1929290 RepID=UPI0022CBC12A|nr:histidine phosphatase family protein [Silanimonas sp.]MCZ8167047.1 histidine phosphatase family protein [Silanimonas sp.]